MRVMRGKTFEGNKGVWEKIEVELDFNDLLPDELAAPKQIQLQLLEIRADRNLILFMSRHDRITKKEAAALLEELQDYKNSLLSIRPKPELRTRG
jgi:hypothetical protein